jgi:branched-chain amino acid aminotransferase
MLVYVNGKFYPENEAKVSVFDHGYLYGDGVYEGIRAYNGYIFRLKDHIDRLYESAKTLAINIRMSKKEMKEACAETFRRNHLKDGYIRLVVSRGVGRLGMDPRKCENPTIIIIPATYVVTFTGLKPLKVIISSIRRTPQFCVPSSAKTLNYVNNILARIDAINANADEAIILDWRGYVSEGPGDNIFLVKKGKIATPPLQASILGGITRQVIIEVAKGLNMDVSQKDITIHDLYNADEAFLTATGVEVHPIGEVDGRKIGTGEVGPITKVIVEEFKKETRNPKAGYPIF